jgi:myo-inositol 2-dehydrogenase / D-chiro-inositol 1-dehydrogenase
MGSNSNKDVELAPGDAPSTTSGRREFLKRTGALGGALLTQFPAILPAQTATKNIKIGLVGCGGRGTGAASQALHADDYSELTAVADIYQENVDRALAQLGKIKAIGSRVKVEKSNQFLGLDAFQKVIDSGVDVVLLATPPGFRPIHFAASVAAGKHVFCEKPVSTDVPGARSVLENCEIAKQKNLSVVSGFAWRRSNMIQETFQKIQDGAIGRLVAYYATYYTNPVKPMPPASTRPAGMSDVEWQIRNWYNFVWLSGDSLVEQAVHNVDKITWAMKDEPPVSCVATGGRSVPAEGGNIFDHFAVNYLYADGTRAFLENRQMEGCFNDNSDYLLGSDGGCTIGRGNTPTIDGKNHWKWTGRQYDRYQREHDILFAAIRGNQPVNDGKKMTTSTLVALMGRMAAYTGQQVTWEEVLNSKERLFPEHLDWNGSLEVRPRAVPGVTRLI